MGVAKSRPHCNLMAMQEAIAAEGPQAFTVKAIFGGAAMGLDIAAMLPVIAPLAPAHFYKSMTTHANRRVRQDVCHAPCPNGLAAYIKLTQVAEHVVIQFEEK